ncbi:MAG: hypothetical protein DBX55_10180 [Verrucomicrobia bacterium]|nr:MAG: hypothetical protein DBX55_10180 [Verrucomicrobiota bacterium]
MRGFKGRNRAGAFARFKSAALRFLSNARSFPFQFFQSRGKRNSEFGNALQILRRLFRRFFTLRDEPEKFCGGLVGRHRPMGAGKSAPGNRGLRFC